MQQGLTRRRIVVLLAAAPIFQLRAAWAQPGPQVNDFGNWRVVSIANNSHAFVIPERLTENYAQTADKSNYGSANLDLEYWSLNGGSYSATLTVDTKTGPLGFDAPRTVTLYLDDVETGSFQVSSQAKQDALGPLGGLQALTAAHKLRVDMLIGDETLTILNLDLTGIADAVPAMKVIPDRNYNAQDNTPPAHTDSGSGDCFITTACCGLMGLPDDCWELRTLRRLRDDVMLSTADGRADVARYYRLAPAILRAMHEQGRERRLLGLYARYIFPSALAAWLGFHGTARRLYSAMMTDVTRRYLAIPWCRATRGASAAASPYSAPARCCAVMNASNEWSDTCVHK